MTPTPTPVPLDPDLVNLIQNGLEAAVLGLALLLALAFLFVWAILRAAKYEAPSSLIVALSLLTFLSLAGAISTGETELITLAATGIGALAGAVSAQFTEKRRSEDDDGDADR